MIITQKIYVNVFMASTKVRKNIFTNTLNVNFIGANIYFNWLP
jgi:hypothetical protein